MEKHFSLSFIFSFLYLPKLPLWLDSEGSSTFAPSSEVLRQVSLLLLKVSWCIYLSSDRLFSRAGGEQDLTFLCE